MSYTKESQWPLLLKILIALLFCAFHVEAADSTNTVRLAVGKTYSLDLDSNPSTGYHWKLTSPTNQVVVQVASTYEPMAHAEGMVGSGGSEHWTFKAVAKGRAQVGLKYARPWEKEAIETKNVLIICE